MPGSQPRPAMGLKVLMGCFVSNLEWGLPDPTFINQGKTKVKCCFT